MWVREEGYAESCNGMGSAVGAMSAGILMPLGSDGLPGGIGTGTVLVFRGDSTWFIGSGSAYRNATSIGSASSSLQFILASTLYTAGLSQPAAPTVYLTPPA